MNTATAMQNPSNDDGPRGQRVLERMVVAPGTRIFHQGDPASVAYIIESGLVELIDENGEDCTVITTLSRGEILGEMALIDGQARSATARAVKQTVLAIVPREAFDDYMTRTPPFMRKLMEVMTQRLRRQTRQVLMNQGGAR